MLLFCFWHTDIIDIFIMFSFILAWKFKTTKKNTYFISEHVRIANFVI